jgi:hypothetical protein
MSSSIIQNVPKRKGLSLGSIRMKYPPSSPDLAPCDFFLFGYAKKKLKDIVFSDEEELFVAIWGFSLGDSRGFFAECLVSVCEATKRLY